MSPPSFNALQEDAIKLVRSLIDSNKGDVPRLQRILGDLEDSKVLDEADQIYIKTLSETDSQTDMPPSPAGPVENDQDSEGLAQAPAENQEEPEGEAITETRNMPSRKRVITIAAIIAAVVVAYVGLDTYAVGQLQFRPHSGNQFQISPTEIYIQADVCNPSFFPATFNKYEISAFYNSNLIEKAEIDGATVSPKGLSTLNGIFALNPDAINKLRYENATFDPSRAKITTSVDAPIFGTIPFSVVKEYTAEQFQDVLKNGPPGSFSCQGA